jgi:hypothetical protein
MATASRPNSSLQQAASAVFAVTTVVPLLVFVWTLHRIGALSHVQSQMGLGLALGIALVGFYIFRRLMGQMSQLIQGLGRVVQQGMRPANDARGSSVPQGRGVAGLIAEYKPPARDEQAEPVAAALVTTPAAAHAVVAVAPPRPASRPTEPAQPIHRSEPIPGLGMIQEVDDLSHAMAKLWMAEALAYKGRRVTLSIMNARAPITGTLVDVTHDALLIDQDGGGQVTISYGRLSGIDAA